ncbi:hypothetical protein BPT24_268 [Tenacibaculum phage pT24]|uniref:Uncharacterized protein n=1 Tax=Tenacibaculum phage pT24 TaxID=1880590 RepID=A0A1B4XX51_9CAUD|nr:hypothetical protein HYP10_gp260 [Tenacibaculum phage pT24]BAV39385.1 hypothetical protein BPT24_268 [Tenacibaculum phage pT24]
MMNFIYGVLTTLYFVFNTYAMFEEAKHNSMNEKSKFKRYLRLTYVFFFASLELMFYILTHLLKFVLPLDFIKMSFLKTFWKSKYKKMYESEIMRDYISRMAERARKEKPWYYIPRYNWILGDKLLKGERILFAKIKYYLDCASDISDWESYARFFYSFNTYLILLLINHYTLNLEVYFILIIYIPIGILYNILYSKQKYREILDKYALDGIFRVAVSRYIRYIYYWIVIITVLLLSFIIFDVNTTYNYSKLLNDNDFLTNTIIIIINSFPLVFEIIRQSRRKSKGLSFRFLPLLVMLFYTFIFTLATI